MPLGSHRSDDPLLQLLLRCGADLAGGELTALEQHQRRDRHDAVFRRGRGILVDVELEDRYLAVERIGNLLEGGTDHPAGAAPLGPEVHHDGPARLEHGLIERWVSHLVDHGRTLIRKRICRARNYEPPFQPSREPHLSVTRPIASVNALSM